MLPAFGFGLPSRCFSLSFARTTYPAKLRLPQYFDNFIPDRQVLVPFAMECHHCGERFEDKEAFDSHLTYHLNVQKELRRPKDRSYGARYVSAKKKTATQGPAASPEKKTGASEVSILKENANPHDATALSKTRSTASATESDTMVVAMDARSVPRKANWDMRSPEAVRGLQKVLDKYPIFPSTAEGPQLDTQLSTASDASCKHCSAIFSHM